MTYTLAVRTCALQSGSNGNAIYVEADGVALLIDAGISGRQARLRLEEHARDIRAVDALILSHAHADHTRGAGVHQRMFKIPVHAAPATISTIRPYVGKLNDVKLFQPGRPFCVGPVTIHTIRTPHDAPDAVAFVLEHAGKRLGVFTDLGHPFAALAEVLPTLDAVYLESNYDVQMLVEGPYPAQLKARIRSQHGHISNDEAAELLRSHARGRLQWAALAHLSGHNNTPEVALETHRAALGAAFPLLLTSREAVSPMFEV